MSITKKQIALWNSTFRNATKAEKRILIAKDVLLQLKTKKYKAEDGHYITLTSSKLEDYSKDVRSNFDKASCKCCQLGGLLMSLTKFNNKFTFEDIVRGTNGESSSVWKELSKFFSVSQLYLMEYAFEGWEIGCNDGGIACSDLNYSPPFVKNPYLAEEFYNKYPDSKDRMKAIMENLIKNKGTFKL